MSGDFEFNALTVYTVNIAYYEVTWYCLMGFCSPSYKPSLVSCSIEVVMSKMPLRDDEDAPAFLSSVSMEIGSDS